MGVPSLPVPLGCGLPAPAPDSGVALKANNFGADMPVRYPRCATCNHMWSDHGDRVISICLGRCDCKGYIPQGGNE